MARPDLLGLVWDTLGERHRDRRSAEGGMRASEARFRLRWTPFGVTFWHTHNQSSRVRQSEVPSASGIGMDAALKAGCVPAKRNDGASGAGNSADIEACTCSVLQLHCQLEHITMKLKVVVQSTLLTPCPNRFTAALPPRGSRDPP